MTPLVLSPEQVHQALTGKVTIARPMEPQPPDNAEMVEFHQNEQKGFECLNNKVWWFTAAHEDMWPCSHDEAIPCPFGPVGSEFWVQEEFAFHLCFNAWSVEKLGDVGHDGNIIYLADKKSYTLRGMKKAPITYDLVREASTMPRWASRLTLRHTGTEVKRVLDIDASEKYSMGFGVQTVWREDWQSRHGDQYPWNENPWIWLSTFEEKE